MLETSSVRFMSINTNGVNGYLGTNIVPGSLGKKDSGFSLTSLVENEEPMPTPYCSGTFEVVSGTPCLIGGVGNWTHGKGSNASMWIQDPFGTIINTKTDPTATTPNGQANLFLVPHSAGDGTIMALVLLNPTPGIWKVGLNYDPAVETSPFEINVTAVPAGGMYQIMLAYQGLYDQKHQSNSLGQGDPVTFLFCQIAAFVIALIIVIIAASLSELTESSPLVVSIGKTFSTPPENVMAFIDAILAQGITADSTVEWVLTKMCQFFKV